MIREIMKIGSFSLSGYQFFYIFGILLTVTVILILSRREHFDLIETVNYLIFGMISGIAGAKIYPALATFLASPSRFLEEPAMFLKILKGGGVFYGGIIAMILFAVLYTRKFFRGSEWRVFDITVVGGALGHVSGRLGCFSAGCCYGVPTGLPWGVRFPFHGKDPHFYQDTFIHPTQLYEAILNLINFIVLILVWRRRRFEGQVFALYLINYGFIRFFVEFFRNDGGRGYILKGPSNFLSLSLPQFISILLIFSGIVIYRVLKSRSES